MTETKFENGKYLINLDEDPEWEFVFDPAMGTASEFIPINIEPSEGFNWIIIIVIFDVYVRRQ